MTTTLLAVFLALPLPAGTNLRLAVEGGSSFAADTERVPKGSLGGTTTARLALDFAGLDGRSERLFSAQVGAGWFGFPEEWRGAGHVSGGMRFWPPVRSSLEPWVDTDAGVARSGDRTHFLLGIGAGFDAAVWHLRLGPFVRYVHLADDGDDLELLLLGAAVGFAPAPDASTTPLPVIEPLTASAQLGYRCPELETPPAPPPGDLELATTYISSMGRAPGCAATGDCEPRLLLPMRVYFSRDESKLDQSESEALDFVARFLLENPSVRSLRLEGHTDETGSLERNMQLSLGRSQSVLEALVARGVARERLDARGLGSGRPTVLAATEEGRRTNRRVEFIIVQPGQAPTAPRAPASPTAAREPTPPAPIPFPEAPSPP